MYSQVTFKFSIGTYNGSMGMDIFYNDSLLLSKKSFESDTFTFTSTLDLPGTVSMHVYGKNPLDTLVDDGGNVIADKYIKLEELLIDRVPLHILSLINLPELECQGQLLRTNYWGFNGTVRIKMEHEDSFFWHLKELRKKSSILDK